MTISVAEVMSLDALSSAQARVISGEDSLERPVGWVRRLSRGNGGLALSDPESNGAGGQLLVVGEDVIEDVLSDLDQLVGQAREHVAALLVERVPEAEIRLEKLIRVAGDAGLPVLVSDEPLEALRIAEQMHEAILRRQQERIERAEEIGREFTQLVLRGPGLSHLVHHLAEIVDNPVVVEDLAHEIVAMAAYETPIDEVIPDWSFHSRAHHDNERCNEKSFEGIEPPCIWRPLMLREDAWGRVHVLAVDSEFGELSRIGLERGAAAMSLALLTSPNPTYLAEYAKGSILLDVNRGRHIEERQLLHYARSVGVELSGRRLVAMNIQFLDINKLAIRRHLLEHDLERLRVSALNLVKQTLRKAGASVLAAIEPLRLLALVSLPETTPPVDCEAIAWDVLRDFERELDLAVSIGLSGDLPLQGLRAGFVQAWQASPNSVPGLGPPPGVHRFDDFSIDRLLARAAAGPELAGFVEVHLGKLLKHDATARIPLTETLEVYLESGRNKTLVATRLFLERRTVYHRLEKIVKILGRSVDEPHTAMELWIAIRGLRLLQAGRVDDPS